jgi:hypothetical protein
MNLTLPAGGKSFASSMPPAKDHAIRALLELRNIGAWGNAEKVPALAKLKSARAPMLALAAAS